jgi:hypothetical protein
VIEENDDESDRTSDGEVSHHIAIELTPQTSKELFHGTSPMLNDDDGKIH